MDPDANESDVAKAWDFPGWGTAERLTNLAAGGMKVSRPGQPTKRTLGTLKATAICGNDITSSCLYVSALCIAQAGALAPLSLGIVAVILYLFRRVYAEVGSALPLNGGTYTVLLNTTGKKLAATAACLTLLSYMATAVISANEAMHYAHNLWPALDVLWATAGLLATFAALNIIGISESAVVAVGIFILHLLTLTILAVAGITAVASDPSMLSLNWEVSWDSVSLGRALFFGVAAGMLGISGFESSANFIEEQKEGVFPKTLRNMWVAVAIFNPLMAFLALGLLPLADIQEVPPDLLAQMGDRSWGPWLRICVSIDAVLVLSGAVLTSFVGVTGLVRRMTLDRCLPQVFLRENRLRGTNHWIILGFLFVCLSVLLATKGHVITLAGVYTVSFLSVMALFAVGNMLLKVKRRQLPRSLRANWPTVVVALVAVLLGLLGNVLLDPASVRVFSIYAMITLGSVAVMFLRVQIMQAVLFASAGIVTRVKGLNEWLSNAIQAMVTQVNARSVIYFAKADDAAALNRAALYVLRNEQTDRLKVVHVYSDEDEIPAGLAENLSTIDHLYPQLRIDFLAVKGTFGPELIELLSHRLKVPKNYMFIGTPGHKFPHRIETLGGVRLIL